MQISKNTILVTGGASGIGLALATRLLRAGNQVVICGRRQEKLREAADKNPGLLTYACDLNLENDRIGLVDWVTHEFPQLNVIVNNAGIQRRVKLGQSEEWKLTRQEIVTNFESPVHLCTLFVPHLLKKQNPAIVNVTSGLSYAPLTMVPIYSATKAAMHSFTLSLRQQLSTTPIEVIEIIPPAVNTDLGGVGLHAFGVPVDEFADAVVARLGKGETEIAYGMAEERAKAWHRSYDESFKSMNQPERR